MKKIFIAAAAAFAAVPASAQLYLSAGIGEAKTDTR